MFKSNNYFNPDEKRILTVNGCCIQIMSGIYFDSHSIFGPGPIEPYIRTLYTSKNTWDYHEQDVDIWCDTIDED